MNKELDELEKWIDDNSILVEFSSNGIKFIADLRRKLHSLQSQEKEGEIELIQKIDSKFEQERYVLDRPKGYHPQDVKNCVKIIETVEIIKGIIKTK